MTAYIRRATLEDAAILAQLHIAGWQGAYGGIVNQEYLDGLSVERRIEDWQNWLPEPDMTVYIAEKDGQAVGFISFGKLHTQIAGQSNIRPTYTAEIYALYLLPEAYRQGIGRQLMVQAASDLNATRKHSGLALWALTDNHRAGQFYTALGGQRIGSKMIEIGGAKHKESCYGWRDLRKLLPK